MAPETRHFQEELQELLDQRLSVEARQEVERHLAACAECQRTWEALRWTKQVARQQGAVSTIPMHLEKDILAALAVADSDRSATVLAGQPARPWWRRQRAVLAYACGLLLLFVLTLTYFWRRLPQQPTPASSVQVAALPAVVAGDYQNFKANQLPLQLQTSDGKALEQFFAANGLAFDTRVFDLGMMNYRLVGGRTHRLLDRPSALFVYRGKDGQILLCQMYPGLVTELPAAAVSLHENKGIQFFLYQSNGITTVFWQEGTVTCVLTSDIAAAEVLQLAFAKAMKI